MNRYTIRYTSAGWNMITCVVAKDEAEARAKFQAKHRGACIQSVELVVED